MMVCILQVCLDTAWKIESNGNTSIAYIYFKLNILMNIYLFYHLVYGYYLYYVQLMNTFLLVIVISNSLFIYSEN